MKHSLQTPNQEPQRLIRLNRVAVALLLTVGVASAETISQIGAWPGYTRHILRQVWSETTNAYVTTAEGVQIFDLSDPLHPQEHSFLPCFEWWESPADISFQSGNSHLSIGVGVSSGGYQNRVKGIDVSNLNDPQLVWLGLLDHRPNQVTQSGDKVYSSHQNYGISVSTWGAAGTGSSPGSVTNASGRVVVVGTRLYVPTLSGFQIFSTSSYGLLGTFDGGAEVKAMAVNGVYAYLAAAEGLRIVDVTYPAALTSAGFLPLAFSQYEPIALELFGSQACLIFEQTNLLMVVDVDPPEAPAEVGSYGFTGPTTDLSVSDGRAFVMAADTAYGAPDLHILDLSDPAHPSAVSRLYAVGSAKQLALQGNTLFVADGNNGLCVLDTGPPSSLDIIGHKTGDGNCVAAANQQVFLGASLGGFSVFDVSSPDSPLLVTNVSGWNPVQTMEASENALYRIEGWPGSEEFAVADINNNFAEVGRLYSWDMGISQLKAFGMAGDQFALMVDDLQGKLVVIDVQAAGLPIVTNYLSDAKIVDVVGRVDGGGTNAFLATTNGLEILDLGDPNNIASIGTWNCPPGFVPHCIGVGGNLIGLASTNHLWVIDINEIDGVDPVVAETDLALFLSEMILSDNQLYAAAGADGVIVYQIGSAPAQPTLIITDHPPNQVTLEWSAAGTRWVLQQSEDPGDPDSWTPIPGSETATSTNLPREPTPQFFRLKQ